MGFCCITDGGHSLGFCCITDGGQSLGFCCITGGCRSLGFCCITDGGRSLGFCCSTDGGRLLGLCLITECVLSFLQIGADAEHEDNISEKRRQLGKKVVYGQVIQVNQCFHLYSIN